MSKKPSKKQSPNCINLRTQIANANICDKRREIQTIIYNKLKNQSSSPKSLPSPLPTVSPKCSQNETEKIALETESESEPVKVQETEKKEAEEYVLV
jgi:hypothetical protein